MKESNSKTTFPGRKQIFRRFQDGQAVGDRLGLNDEAAIEGEQPMLQLVMEHGKVLQPPEPLETIARRSAESVASLSAGVRQLEAPEQYPVSISDALEELTDRTSRRLIPQLSP
jgi:nicotinate phosphoribosyltransferase